MSDLSASFSRVIACVCVCVCCSCVCVLHFAFRRRIRPNSQVLNLHSRMTDCINTTTTSTATVAAVLLLLPIDSIHLLCVFKILLHVYYCTHHIALEMPKRATKKEKKREKWKRSREERKKIRVVVADTNHIRFLLLLIYCVCSTRAQLIFVNFIRRRRRRRVCSHIAHI